MKKYKIKRITEFIVKAENKEEAQKIAEDINWNKVNIEEIDDWIPKVARDL